MPLINDNYARQLAEAEFKKYGLTPSEEDIVQAAPNFKDPWGQGMSNGAAAVATMVRGIKAQNDTPEAKMKAAKGKAGEQYGAVDSMFSQFLGRNATQEEKDHFGTLLATGDVDPYTVQSYLQQLPESVKAQDAKFRGELSTELQGQDSRYFNEQIMPSIQSQFAQQGRDIRSSGFANSLAQAATQQNRQRETFLSNLTAQQYAGNQANAREDYNSNVARQYALQDYSRGRAAQLQDNSQNRIQDLQNYRMQQEAYNDYLRRYGKRNNMAGIGSMVGGLVGTGVGAYFGGTQGAQLGNSIGGGVGGTAQRMWG